MKATCPPIRQLGHLGCLSAILLIGSACADQPTKPGIQPPVTPAPRPPKNSPDTGVQPPRAPDAKNPAKPGNQAPKPGEEFIVISLAGKPNSGCKIIQKDRLYAAIYAQSFGPASYAACQAWVQANCSVDPKPDQKPRP